MSGRVTIDFDTGNAAFEDNPQEVARVLASATFAISRALRANRSDSVSLFDLNGNRVGKATFTTRR